MLLPPNNLDDRYINIICTSIIELKYTFVHIVSTVAMHYSLFWLQPWWNVSVWCYRNGRDTFNMPVRECRGRERERGNSASWTGRDIAMGEKECEVERKQRVIERAVCFFPLQCWSDGHSMHSQWQRYMRMWWMYLPNKFSGNVCDSYKTLII